LATAAHEAAPCHGVRQQPEPQHGGARAAAEAGPRRQLLRHRHQRQAPRPVRPRAQCVPVRHALPPDARGSQEQGPRIVSSLPIPSPRDESNSHRSRVARVSAAGSLAIVPLLEDGRSRQHLPIRGLLFIHRAGFLLS
jgi:hypothetical protein